MILNQLRGVIVSGDADGFSVWLTEMLVEMLTNSDNVREVIYYIHCIETLNLESATLTLKTKLASVSDESLLINILGAIAKIGFCHNPQNLFPVSI